MTELAQTNILAQPQTLPLLPSQVVVQWGRTLVVAPHADDESLGCGGVLALLRRADVPVHVLLVSDGSKSHPNSRRYPAAALRDLREAELRQALAILGVPAEALTCWRTPDTAVPQAGDLGFATIVERCINYLMLVQPHTILLPWRRDPHHDHRATFQIVQAALGHLSLAPRVLEYPIWVWELGESGDAPTADEACAWRLDISPVVALKQQAIAAHRSQTTDLIDDDPTGFRLEPAMLARFAQPWEIFVEALP